ncbi:sodium pump decarboxylase subunit gamma [Natronospirillum operosum]|uniref:Oxaloacetate decarboxylase gamma chain n=1 Tax=Natronospirillum operosum TaxID=2759953 RepID=A0A4Z0WHA7_9GAMM|nr:OadG family transporter subunit [Natronospirillum operosum]TGG95156.1 sodium pump decarboxylase subunit gamma [Natronospirillum operosum]
MSELLQEGLQLMALGMGTVFAFLVILIFGTIAMSSLVGRFSKPEVAAQSGGRRKSGAQMDQIAAVAAAARAAHSR